jgi:putative phosphoesterase
MMAIISDVHANLAALQAVLADIDAQGCTEILSLGDVIGYNAEPEECVHLMKARAIRNILGNHDSYITTGKNCERSAVVASIIDDHRTRLSADSVGWLRQSMEYMRLDDMLFLHGGPEDPVDQYIYEVNQSLFPEGVNMLFAGHTHVQTCLEVGGKTFCNPGSVGQPRDGDPRAAYAILDGRKILLRRVSYNVTRTIQVMNERGYEPYKGRGLATGSQINGKISTITVGG